MARKSRKNIQLGLVAEAAQACFDTAIYARLSKEDNGIDADSIENQIYMMRQYINNYPELNLKSTFIDNGQTGTNFERPGFHAMMDAVRKGSIRCIVVKDLSRFGRNYVEAGNYLEKIFPYLGIRFISVNDHLDSLNVGKKDTLLVSLKSILHDTYAKDISKKVSTAIDIKKKRGKFLGKIPPYGYIRDAADSHQLVIHEERAQTIRQIFRWSLEEDGAAAIAHKLNDMEIPTLYQIRWMEGHSDGKSEALWRASSVASILTNHCYLGCMVERKSSNALYQGKKNKTIPRNEWKIIENTHEAIIDQGTFDRVQTVLENSLNKRHMEMKRNSHRIRTDNVLCGFIKCGICGGSVCRDSGYFRDDGTLVHYHFSCPNKYIKTGCCTSGSIKEKDLLDAVYHICKKQLEVLTDMDRLIAHMEKGNGTITDIEVLHQKLTQLKRDQNHIRSRRNSLYADWKDGLLTEKEYHSLSEKYAADIQELKMQTKAEKQLLLETEDRPHRGRDWMQLFMEFRNTDKLTREMCTVMIESVVVNGNMIQVHFKFASGYEKTVGSMLDDDASAARERGAV